MPPRKTVLEADFSKFLDLLTEKRGVNKRLRNFYFDDKGNRIADDLVPGDHVIIQADEEKDTYEGIVLTVTFEYVAIESPIGSGTVVLVRDLFISTIKIIERDPDVARQWMLGIAGKPEDHEDDGGITQ